MITYKPIIHSIEYKDCRLAVLRLDLIHPEVSGNKWFKLKYNLEQAKREKKTTILTFGGAYSNHIAATAVACKENGFRSIGIIRGEELSANNSTLALAKKNGMELYFVTREEYKQKKDPSYLNELKCQFENAYIIPEGGDNEAGQRGCEEIVTKEMRAYTSVFCAYGTGTTFKGITKSILPNQNVIGVNVLKYEAPTLLPNSTVLNSYHFGGYAKHTKELIEFKNWFETEYHIPLDYIYTVKLFFAVFDLINKKALNKTHEILMIHSGGLQGNGGYEKRYNLKPMRHVSDTEG